MSNLSNLDLLKVASVVITDDAPMYKRPISSTIGRAASPLTALVLGSKYPLKAGPTKEDLEYLEDYYTNDPDEDIPLAIHPNRVRPLMNLGRVWKRKDLSAAGKLLGTVNSPIIDLAGAMGRRDHYNPWAHSTSLFTKDPAINLHELGHATDFDAKRKYRSLYALGRTVPFAGIPVTLYQEAKASKIAVNNAIEKYIQDLPEEEREATIRRMNRVLSGGFGSYYGTILGSLFGAPFLGLAGALAGQRLGSGQQPFGKIEDKKDDKKDDSKGSDSDD